MVTKFHRPRDAAEAQSILKSNPSALPLAGGTWLLAGQFRKTPMEVVSVEGILPSGIERSPARDGGLVLVLGAGATFQDIADSSTVPELIRQAALGMADRNIRNRATVGGNIGANKSCASLVPVFLVAEGLYETVPDRSGSHGTGSTAGPATGFAAETPVVPVPAVLWKQSDPAKIISRVLLHFEPNRLYAYRRWSRTACDLSVITVAVSYRLENTNAVAAASHDADVAGNGVDNPSALVRDARIALGGMGAAAKRFPKIEAALEGKSLPSRDVLEALVAPFFEPKSDARGSAAFKRYRAACLLAEALHAARPVAAPVTATPAPAVSAAAAAEAAAPEVQS